MGAIWHSCQKGNGLYTTSLDRSLYQKPDPKGTEMGTPNRDSREYSRNIMGIYLPPIVFLLFSWGSLSEVPIHSLCPLLLKALSRQNDTVLVVVGWSRPLELQAETRTNTAVRHA